MYSTKKKFLLCLLAVVLCLSLCACGGNDDSGSGSGSGGNGFGADIGNSGGSQSFVCEGAVTPDASGALMQYFYGEWTRVYTSPVFSIDSITIREDGTCKMGDTEYEFAFCKNSTEDCIMFHVHKDGRTQYLMSAEKTTLNNVEYDVALNIGLRSCDNGGSPAVQDTFWNADQVQEVQITNDNLWDYFEVKDELMVNKNAFGEVTGISVKQSLVLKDDYKLSYWATQTAAMEFSWIERSMLCEIDMDQNTISFAGAATDGIVQSTIVECRNGRLDLSSFSKGCSYSATTGMVNGYRTDFEILRSIGSLYLLK